MKKWLRPDVARALRNDAYNNSGWELQIPVRDIRKGVHEINFMVITGDELSYYEIFTKIQVEVN